MRSKQIRIARQAAQDAVSSRGEVIGATAAGRAMTCGRLRSSAEVAVTARRWTPLELAIPWTAEQARKFPNRLLKAYEGIDRRFCVIRAGDGKTLVSRSAPRRHPRQARSHDQDI